MAKLDPFLAKLVAAVRSMPDDAIIDLIRAKIDEADNGNLKVAAPSRKRTPTKRRTTPARTARRKKRATKRKTKRSTASSREALLVSVEKIVKKSKGLGLAEVAKAVRAPKTRVQAALRELKKAKRIYQAGDRRFSRYASTAKAAKAASVRARKGG